MQVGDDNPQENPDEQEDENEDDDAVGEREGVAAVMADGACDEPVDVEEGGYDDEEGDGSVDHLLGVMSEEP